MAVKFNPKGWYYWSTDLARPPALMGQGPGHWKARHERRGNLGVRGMAGGGVQGMIWIWTPDSPQNITWCSHGLGVWPYRPGGGEGYTETLPGYWVITADLQARQGDSLGSISPGGVRSFDVPKARAGSPTAGAPVAGSPTAGAPMRHRHRAMGERSHIPAGYSPFANLYATGDVAESLAERDVAFAVTRWRDKLGNVIVRKVNQSPVAPGARPPVVGIKASALYANAFPPSTMGSKSAPVVSQGMQFDNQPIVGAPHHGGHGGGGHRPGGGRRRLAPDSWNLWGDYGYPVYEVEPCPEGYITLPDGTCVHASVLDFQTGQGLVVHNETVGARKKPGRVRKPMHPIPRSLIGAPLLRVGSSADVRPYDSLYSAGQTPPVNPPAAIDPATGQTYASEGQFPPFNQPVSPPAVATGTQTSGSPAADSLNLQWVALAQFIASNSQLGPNPSLPMSYAPDLASTQWLTDLGDWQTFYSQVGTFSLSQVTGDLAGWQAYANSWGQYLRTQAPQAQIPANFPTGQAGLASLPAVSSLIPSASSYTDAVKWTVIAVAVAAGIWLLWPVAAHFGLAAG
jgi:hypothetical protein